MEQEDYLVSDTQRIEDHVDDISSLPDPDDRMLAILELLTTTVLIPEVGRYYTFVYKPKTPRIQYDEYPLIACVGIFKWGFRGINYHWAARGGEPFRNYTWEEVVGFLHLVYPLELNDMRSIPYQNFKINT